VPCVEQLCGEPELSKYFRPRPAGGPFLTTDSSMPGRFLLKAWQHGIVSINPEVIKIASRAAEVWELEDSFGFIRVSTSLNCFLVWIGQERIVNIIRELIKQRKSFRMKSRGHVHFGEPHENPYILSRHHIPTAVAAEKR